MRHLSFVSKCVICLKTIGYVDVMSKRGTTLGNQLVSFTLFIFDSHGRLPLTLEVSTCLYRFCFPFSCFALASEICRLFQTCVSLLHRRSLAKGFSTPFSEKSCVSATRDYFSVAQIFASVISSFGCRRGIKSIIVHCELMVTCLISNLDTPECPYHLILTLKCSMFISA